MQATTARREATRQQGHETTRPGAPKPPGQLDVLDCTKDPPSLHNPTYVTWPGDENEQETPYHPAHGSDPCQVDAPCRQVGPDSAV